MTRVERERTFGFIPEDSFRGMDVRGLNNLCRPSGQGHPRCF